MRSVKSFQGRPATLLGGLFILAASLASARGINMMSRTKMEAASDLVVIATPVKVKKTNELLKGTLLAFSGTYRGIEATFAIHQAIKGSEKRRFRLHYYEMDKGPVPAADGPGLVSFKAGSGIEYLMFLKQEPDGRYAPITGQVDANLAILIVDRTKPIE
jgi:hypothetical protein